MTDMARPLTTATDLSDCPRCDERVVVQLITRAGVHGLDVYCANPECAEGDIVTTVQVLVLSTSARVAIITNGTTT